VIKEKEMIGMEFPGIREPYEKGWEDAKSNQTMDFTRHGYSELIHRASYISGWVDYVLK